MKFNEIISSLKYLHGLFKKFYLDEHVVIGVYLEGFQIENGFYLTMVKEYNPKETLSLNGEYTKRSFVLDGIVFLTLYRPDEVWKEMTEEPKPEVTEEKQTQGEAE